MALFQDDDLDLLIAQITDDAHDEDEHLWAFRAAMEELALPVDAEVMAEKVDLLRVHYDGNPRRGLVAVCKRKGRKHVVSLVDVRVDGGAVAEHIAAYRRWLGVDAEAEAELAGRARRAEPVDPDAPVDAVLLKVGQNSARIRPLGIDEEVTFRGKRVWAHVPGQILTIKPRKRWKHNNYPCMSGEITDARVDIPALGLDPITVECVGEWDPSRAEPFADELSDLWDQIAAKGKRETYEIEWIVPGFEPDRDDLPPVAEAIELYLAGDRCECRDILAGVLMKDLRCIEAHTVLGAWEQDGLAHHAILHLEVAVGLIDFALGGDFDGVLLWDRFGNKSVIVALDQYARCLWQLGRLDEARAAFERAVWIHPTDSTGALTSLADVRAGTKWEERRPTESD